jgi:hypothetical protein
VGNDLNDLSFLASKEKIFLPEKDQFVILASQNNYDGLSKSLQWYHFNLRSDSIVKEEILMDDFSEESN